MLYAITGHTSGLGQAVAAQTEHIGFSRSNGYDLSKPDTVDRIITDADHVDVFINNACIMDNSINGFSQITLLYALYNHWKGKKKLIVNIGSNSSDGIKMDARIYPVYKAALDKASEQLSYQGDRCSVINIRPGWLDVERVSWVSDPKIDPSVVVDAIKTSVELWSTDRALIASQTILPMKKGA